MSISPFDILALYRADVGRALQEPWQQLVERARANDVQARSALVASCLAEVLEYAISIHEARRPPHLELADLIQEGSLAMVEDIDRALATYYPGEALCAIGRRAIWRACLPPEQRFPQRPYPKKGRHSPSKKGQRPQPKTQRWKP